MGIYDGIRGKAAGGPYHVSFGIFSLTVLPAVYPPTAFTDTLWFAKQMPEIVGARSLLEIGTGTGAIAIACARGGAKVTATDINQEAVKNAYLNAKVHNLDIDVRQGDLYQPIRQPEKFDFIFWSHPFNNWETPVNDILLRSGLDYKYESLKGYIENAKNHLSPNGRLLLGTGDTADLKTIFATAHKAGYSLKLLSKTTMPLETDGDVFITYLLYEFIEAPESLSW